MEKNNVKITENMVKNAEKINLNKLLQDFLKEKEIDFTDGEKYGFPKNSLVIHGTQSDIQVKLIVPKKHQFRYDIKDNDEIEQTLDIEKILKNGINK